MGGIIGSPICGGSVVTAILFDGSTEPKHDVGARAGLDAKKPRPSPGVSGERRGFLFVKLIQGDGKRDKTATLPVHPILKSELVDGSEYSNEVATDLTYSKKGCCVINVE